LLFDGKSSESEFLLSSLIYVPAEELVQGILQVLLQLLLLVDLEPCFDVDGCFLEQVPLYRRTLWQIYKENLGQFRGGPAFYIERD
jgi:hypothetical protein